MSHLVSNRCAFMSWVNSVLRQFLPNALPHERFSHQQKAFPGWWKQVLGKVSSSLHPLKAWFPCNSKFNFIFAFLFEIEIAVNFSDQALAQLLHHYAWKQCRCKVWKRAFYVTAGCSRWKLLREGVQGFQLPGLFKAAPLQLSHAACASRTAAERKKRQTCGAGRKEKEKSSTF